MASTAPQASIVIPTFNRREMLRRCLESLSTQTHPNYEVIVVDDASDDGTPAMLDSFAADHPDLDLRWLRFDEHRGANAARNAGIGESRGGVIAFLDSDCLADPEWLENLVGACTGDRVAGACGIVDDPEPRNIYDLTFRGTHRVLSGDRARRLVGGNMALKREIFDRYTFDTSPGGAADCADAGEVPAASGRCDEETLYLMLRRDGWQIAAAHDARVLHEHYYDRGSFFSQAYKGGRAAARLVYQHHLPQRRDMLPFMLAYASLPLGLIDLWLLLVPAVLFALAVAAILYNDLVLKQKTPWQVARSFPVLLAYYHVRLFGYVVQLVRLYTRLDTLQRSRIAPPAQEFAS